MSKAQFFETYGKLSEKIRIQALKQGIEIDDSTRVIVAGDFNDELHQGTEYVAEDGSEQITFLDQKLGLMDGRSRAPVVSLNPLALYGAFVQRPSETLPYTAGMPDAKGKYGAAGFKFGTTIDMIFDSANVSANVSSKKNISQRGGVVPTLDYKLQYYRAFTGKGQLASQKEMDMDAEFAEHWAQVSNREVVGVKKAVEESTEDWYAAKNFGDNITLASDHVPVFVRTVSTQV
jgi:hypothetical protein